MAKQSYRVIWTEPYKSELQRLKRARRRIAKGMRYATVYDTLVRCGVPYVLSQERQDDTGRALRRCRYRFRSYWYSSCALYIEETAAGRKQYTSMGAAMDALQKVLETNATGG